MERRRRFFFGAAVGVRRCCIRGVPPWQRLNYTSLHQSRRGHTLVVAAGLRKGLVGRGSGGESLQTIWGGARLTFASLRLNTRRRQRWNSRVFWRGRGGYLLWRGKDEFAVFVQKETDRWRRGTLPSPTGRFVAAHFLGVWGFSSC